MDASVPIILFGMATETTAAGTVSYFDAAGIGVAVLLVAAVLFILKSQRARLRKHARTCPRKPDTPADLEKKLRDLQEATDRMDRRLHR